MSRTLIHWNKNKLGKKLFNYGRCAGQRWRSVPLWSSGQCACLLLRQCEFKPNWRVHCLMCKLLEKNESKRLVKISVLYFSVSTIVIHTMTFVYAISSCGQSIKHFMLLNYDSIVVPDWKIPHITTLESQFTSVKCL